MSCILRQGQSTAMYQSNSAKSNNRFCYKFNIKKYMYLVLLQRYSIFDANHIARFFLISRICEALT